MPELSENFINEMKAELEASRAKIMKELDKISVVDEADPDGLKARFPDRGDAEDENAQEVAAFGDRLSLGKTLKDTLKDIDKALNNIAEDKYGICKHCGQPIEEKRLRARPYSSSCIDCKKRLKGE